MKAKELMCDDVVSHNGNFYKVFGVMGRADGVQISPVHLRNSDGLLLGPISCFGSDIEPIPITPEILEKNFNHTKTDAVDWNSGYHCDEYDHNGEYYLQYNWDEHSVHISSLRLEEDGLIIHYIHELQHALRLCGLNDLADNFKV